MQPVQLRLERLERVAASGEAWPVQIGARPRPSRCQPILGPEPGEDRGDVVGVADPIPRPLGEQAQDQRIELRRQGPDQLRRRDGLGVQVRPADLSTVGSDERRTPGGQLVQDAPERIEVGPGIDQLAIELLRRHVRSSAGRLAAELQRLTTERASEASDQPEVEEDWEGSRQ